MTELESFEEGSSNCVRRVVVVDSRFVMNDGKRGVWARWCILIGKGAIKFMVFSVCVIGRGGYGLRRSLILILRATTNTNNPTTQARWPLSQLLDHVTPPHGLLLP